MLLNRRLAAVTLRRNDILCPEGCDLPANLKNRVVTSIDRRGKRIVFTLDDGNRFYIHLGMSGQLTVTDAGAEPLPHTHLEIAIAPDSKADVSVKKPRISNLKSQISNPKSQISNLKSQFSNPVPQPSSPKKVLRFRDPRRFGGIWWLGRDASHEDDMGPEPLTLRPADLFRRLQKTTRAIKSALLDQTLVAGLGNIYVDESLFAAKIHPLRRACDISRDESDRLNRAIKQVLRKAISFKGSTLRDYRDARGESGGFQIRHNVYDRAGKPCRVCKTPIERIVLGGRSTHFCPKCQPRHPKN
jgi:formamidopyrimidine-DNA glycosylase